MSEFNVFETLLAVFLLSNRNADAAAPIWKVHGDGFTMGIATLEVVAALSA
ncbi:hypothetical protein D3C72_2243080 [compost metagenome]